MFNVKQTDYEAVRRLTIDYAKRSGNPAAMDAAIDAAYLHEYLNAVLTINPFLWLGEVRRYVTEADWQNLIRYAASLHLADDELARREAADAARIANLTAREAMHRAVIPSRWHRSRRSAEPSVTRPDQAASTGRKDAEAEADDDEQEPGKRCLEGLWY